MVRRFFGFGRFVLLLIEEPQDEVLEDLPHVDVFAELFASQDEVEGAGPSDVSGKVDIAIYL